MKTSLDIIHWICQSHQRRIRPWWLGAWQNIWQSKHESAYIKKLLKC